MRSVDSWLLNLTAGFKLLGGLCRDDLGRFVVSVTRHGSQSLRILGLGVDCGGGVS